MSLVRLVDAISRRLDAISRRLLVTTAQLVAALLAPLCFREQMQYSTAMWLRPDWVAVPGFIAPWASVMNFWPGVTFHAGRICARCDCAFEDSVVQKSLGKSIDR